MDHLSVGSPNMTRGKAFEWIFPCVSGCRWDFRSSRRQLSKKQQGDYLGRRVVSFCSVQNRRHNAMKQFHTRRYTAMVEPDTEKRKSCMTELSEERRRSCTSFMALQKLNCAATNYNRHDARYDDSASDTVSVTSSLFVGNERSGFSSSTNNYGLSYAFSFEQEWDFLDVPPRLDRQQFVPITIQENKTTPTPTENRDEPPPIMHPRPRRNGGVPIHWDDMPRPHASRAPTYSYADWYNSYTPPGMIDSRLTIWEEN